MTKRLPLLALFFYLSITCIQAQETSYEKGELLIQFRSGTDVGSVMNAYSDIGLTLKQLLSRRMNIWLCTYDTEKIADDAVQFRIKQNKDVKTIQFNHHVQLRRAETVFTKDGRGHESIFELMPNDPRFNEQWALHNTGQSGGLIDADIDAPEAWEYSTGGLTAAGDTIVVAIIDGGTSLTHQDLYFWKNYAEIPGNGIDDDANGYIDDYNGWNAYNNNGNVPSNSHGTHVAGISAARGNNAIGVSGVNWGAQVMPIAGSSGTESVVVIAYDYVLNMRAKYNETNGSQGAFVVSTNASFGVDYGQPANYPLWCGIYDSLGVQGVLSCGATANLNINIDQTGDIPTACPSDYMIAVTNTTRTDVKNTGAAYGLTTIDLGAPGTSILSTIPGNTYSNLTGTSMATPQVTGAIGLMFAAAHPDVLTLYKSNYAAGAFAFRNYLLSAVDTIASLVGKTVTGGRLNVHKAVLAVNQSVPVELKSFTSFTEKNDVILNWTTATEINNSGFAVERMTSGNGWSEIGFIEGKGNSTELNHYSYRDVNLSQGVFYYRIRQGDFDGTFTYSEVIESVIDLPGEFVLLQNYPNPFNPSTKIGFQVPASAGSSGWNVRLKIYDILGNEIAVIVNEQKPAGTYEVEFNGSNLSSGIYFYRMTVEGHNFSQINRMVVLK